MTLAPKRIVVVRVVDEDGRALPWSFRWCDGPTDSGVQPRDTTYVTVVEGLGSAREERVRQGILCGWPFSCTVIAVEPAATVGLLAFNPARGLVEHAIAANGEGQAWAICAVELEMPARAPLEPVSIEVTFSDVPEASVDLDGEADPPWRWWDLGFLGPETGIEFARLYDSDVPHRRVALPPGAYAAAFRVSRGFLLCSDTPPTPAHGVEALQPFDVHTGTPTHLAHTFERSGR